jgi:methanogenic corrinoid protein MtbC1
LKNPEPATAALRWMAAAVEPIAAALMAENGGVCPALGERGRDGCREDIEAHVALLAVALDFGGARPYRQYLQWLARLLRARGLPTQALAGSLRHLADYCGRNLPAGGRQAVLELIAAGGRAFDGDEDVPDYALEPVRLDPAAAILADALIAGDEAAARALILERAGGARLPEVVATVVRPAMGRIGWWWQSGRIGVAQEHLATEIAHRAVDHAFTRAARKPRRRRGALFACVEGNRHALGLRTLADAFEIEGWTAFNLGADVPVDSLPGMVGTLRPELVGLSVSMTAQLPAARAAVAAIRAQPGGGAVRIVLGGLASLSLDEAWRWVGADLAAGDATAALAAAEAMVGA